MASLLNVSDLVAPMQALHEKCVNQTYGWRCSQLLKLRALLVENWDAFTMALKEDLGKCPMEAIATELLMVKNDLNYTLKNLKSWMEPQNLPSPLVCWPGFSRLRHRPLVGPAVLIIGPCNYPVSLLLHPTIGALAAGNPVVMKPSELTPSVETLMHCLVSRYFTHDAVQCVTGGVPETTELLQYPWGRIFFTGSPKVGKIVAAAAAQTLTPVTLELGGKAPVYIDADTCPADIQQIANRIIWAKTVNAGQTCAAVDTLVVEAKLLGTLTVALKQSLILQYGTDPRKSSFGRLVSPKHALRLVEMLQEVENDAHDKTKIIVGGSRYCDAALCYVAPTIVLNPSPESRLMQEEIFGPILPIVTVSSRDEAFHWMRTQLPGTPLCSYIFTSSNAVFEDFATKLTSGSVVRNDCVIHLASHHIPFGGLGSSGYGRYHGKYTFDEFSHAQAQLYRPCFPGADIAMVRYHPYHTWKKWFLIDCNVIGMPFSIPNLSWLWKLLLGYLAMLLIWAYFVPLMYKLAFQELLAVLAEAMASWLRKDADVAYPIK